MFKTSPDRKDCSEIDIATGVPIPLELKLQPNQRRLPKELPEALWPIRLPSKFFVILVCDHDDTLLSDWSELLPLLSYCF